MQKSNKQKKAELQLLINSVVNSVSDSMPKGVNMLVKSIVKTIDEDKIDDILNGIKDFCASIFTHIERIQGDADEITQIQNEESLAMHREQLTGTNG